MRYEMTAVRLTTPNLKAKNSPIVQRVYRLGGNDVFAVRYGGRYTVAEASSPHSRRLSGTGRMLWQFIHIIHLPIQFL